MRICNNYGRSAVSWRLWCILLCQKTSTHVVCEQENNKVNIFSKEYSIHTQSRATIKIHSRKAFWIVVLHCTETVSLWNWQPSKKYTSPMRKYWNRSGCRPQTANLVPDLFLRIISLHNKLFMYWKSFTGGIKVLLESCNKENYRRFFYYGKLI